MDGCFIIEKPAGLTSHDVVARVRKTIRERRVGHTGTLDPFATGFLVVLVGRATRLAQFLSGADKEYEAVIRLGYGTDTGDPTGTRVTNSTAEMQRAQSLPTEQIETALAALRGEIEQMPPMYSAKKIAGRKLYELARRGEEVERKPVCVKVSEFAAITHNGGLLNDNDDGTRDLKVRVVCSAGTAGQFKIEDAITLERLNELAQSESLEQTLISPDATLSSLPALQLGVDTAHRVGQGIDVQVEDASASHWPNGQTVRLRNEEGQLIAVGIYDSQRGTVHPQVVIVNT